MKYLKYFESISKHYFEIDKGEYNIIACNNTFSEFSSKDIKNLFNFSPNILCKFYNNDDTLIHSTPDSIKDECFAKVKYRVLKESSALVYINKMDDEWFRARVYLDSKNIVNSYGEEINSRYYKCDQLDGLLKLLENIYNEVP